MATIGPPWSRDLNLCGGLKTEPRPIYCTSVLDRSAWLRAPLPPPQPQSLVVLYHAVCFGALCVFSPRESVQRLHQVEFVPLLAGEDGGFLVVLHQLVHGGEAALADAEHAVDRLHLEVLVLAGRLQGHREVVGLGGWEVGKERERERCRC